jgi:signal transduction histidine kinase
MGSLSLRQRVFLILSGFVAVAALLGLTLVWYTFRMEGLLAAMPREAPAAALPEASSTAGAAASLVDPTPLQDARAELLRQAWQLRLVAGAAVVSLTGLAALLAAVFVYQILIPLRRLAQEAAGAELPPRSGNEVKALSRRVRVLLHNVDQTQTELERSRESLAHAEKMALVGKLAAGMAHSIRNPFTSVKMRLFSLSRSLEPDDAQQEDLDVIAGEIRHIDTIVQNFLEFSRPPRLRMQTLSPSTVVDAALRLLDQRLRSYGVSVRLDRPGPLPAAQADPEQLKEVLVNLVVNACEAMPGGGEVVIEERVDRAPEGRTHAVIRVRDTGPGIPPHVGEKVFDPFFSTKEHGTGLGLSIARRIITEHGGRLEAASAPSGGAAFLISLPIQEGPP